MERTENAFASLRAAHDDVDEYMEEMEALANDIPLKDTSSQKAYNVYLERLYTLASKGKSGNSGMNVLKALTRQKKNLKKTKPAPSDASRVATETKIESIDDAIELAFRQVKGKKK